MKYIVTIEREIVCQQRAYYIIDADSVASATESAFEQARDSYDSVWVTYDSEVYDDDDYRIEDEVLEVVAASG